MFFDIAKVVYAARRAIAQGVVPGKGESAPEIPVPFGELTSGDREPIIAEVRAYIEGGDPMMDLVGAAIVDALK